MAKGNLADMAAEASRLGFVDRYFASKRNTRHEWLERRACISAPNWIQSHKPSIDLFFSGEKNNNFLLHACPSAGKGNQLLKAHLRLLCFTALFRHFKGLFSCGECPHHQDDL